MKQRILAWLIVVALALAALYGAGWLLWQGVLRVEVNTARAALLVAVALLPITGYACWHLGQLEATGRLAGIDQSMSKMIKGLTQASMLKVGTAQAMQAPSAPVAMAMELPPPEVVYLPPSRGKIVEM